MARRKVQIVYILVAIILTITGGCCPKISRPNVTHYDIDRSKCTLTPSGVCMILNGNAVDATAVDDLIEKTETCVFEAFPRYKKNIRPGCYVVYFPEDWRAACEGEGQQVFGKAPWEACAAKGFEKKENCSCGWRVAVQDGQYIVTTPNLYLFRQGVAELISGWPASELWKSEKMIECMGF